MSINCIRILLEKAAQTHPDKIALVHDERKLTYSELFTRVNQVALYLQELELPKGARIGLYSNKDVSQVIAILSILSTDYILVPLTRLLKPEQVQYIIDDCDIQCVITDKLKLESIERARISLLLRRFSSTTTSLFIATSMAMIMQSSPTPLD